MSVYALGDVHGCSRTLAGLLDALPFDATADRLWLVGDLVGHGPDSPGVLHRVRELDRELGAKLVVVLGNHDLRLIAARYGVAVPAEVQKLCGEILAAPGGPDLLDWLAERPLLHVEEDLVLVHAGLLPRWSIADSRVRADDARALLSSDRGPELLEALYSRQRKEDATPRELRRALETLRVTTTIRTIEADGRLCDHKGSPETAPPGCRPWFELRQPANEKTTVVFGHWASLGLQLGSAWIALDSGCAWGGPLSAIRLEDRRLFQVPRID